MPARLTKPVLLATTLIFLAFTIAELHQRNSDNVGSITVKLPPAHSTPRPAFKF